MNEKEQRVATSCQALKDLVARFVGHAQAGQVREMLAEGVAVNAAMEKVAKVVTNTEVAP